MGMGIILFFLIGLVVFGPIVMICSRGIYNESKKYEPVLSEGSSKFALWWLFFFVTIVSLVSSISEGKNFFFVLIVLGASYGLADLFTVLVIITHKLKVNKDLQDSVIIRLLVATFLILFLILIIFSPMVR